MYTAHSRGHTDDIDKKNMFAAVELSTETTGIISKAAEMLSGMIPQPSESPGISQYCAAKGMKKKPDRK
jgi:hypothetical protein